jgi:glutaminyl-tRNA synthetase
VRLRFGYVIKCERVVKVDGKVTELVCTYNPDPQHKVKGIVHWVSAEHCKDVEVRLYDRLFKDAHPDGGEAHFLTHINPHSLEIVSAKIEAFGATVPSATHWQLERVGYFYVDPVLSKPGAPVFNRAASLKDSWAKKEEPTKRETTKKDAPQAAPTKKVFADAPTPALADARKGYEAKGLSDEEAALVTQSEAVHTFFAAAAGDDLHKQAAKLLINQLLPAAKDGLDKLPFAAADFKKLVALALPGATVKQVLADMIGGGGDPQALAKKHAGMSEAELEKIVHDVIAKHPGGKHGFLVGQVMKAASGKADPVLAKQLVERLAK